MTAPIDADRVRWGRVLGLFAPHRGRVLGVVALVLVVSILGIVNPLLIQVVFDDALFPADGVVLANGQCKLYESLDWTGRPAVLRDRVSAGSDQPG